MSASSSDLARQRAEIYAELEKRPAEARLWAVLGRIDYFDGRMDQALENFATALRHDPNCAMAWAGLGDIATENNRPGDAIFYRREALKREPSPQNKLSLAYDLFRIEEWEEAHALYEARFLPVIAADGQIAPTVRARPFAAPRWQGAKLAAGEKLLVWMEQGAGDEILYAGLLPDVALRLAAGMNGLVVECEPRLVPLFARSFAGAECVARQNPPGSPPHPRLLAPDIAAQIPAGSLGGLLRPSSVSFAGAAPYLRADTARAEELRRRYRDIAGPGRRLVGLSWRSRPFMPREASAFLSDPKSAPFDLFEGLLRRADVAVVNVQYGDNDAELEWAQARGLMLINDGSIDPLRDLDGAAAQIAALDHVITVSNAAAHLAGALGTPAEVLLPAGRACVYHWHHARARSLWYPSARLWRQAHYGDWRGLVEQAVAAV